MITSLQRRFRTDVRLWFACFIVLALLTSWVEVFPDFRLWIAWVLLPISIIEMIDSFSSAMPQLVLGLTVAGSHLIVSWFIQYFVFVVRHRKDEE